MNDWDRPTDRDARGWLVAAVILSAAALAWVSFLGLRSRLPPERCTSGLENLGSRCCAPGQELSEGACVGLPSSCPSDFELVRTPIPGCVLRKEAVTLSGGTLAIGPTDWDSLELVERQTITVLPFAIDRSEVTNHSYDQCVRENLCTPPGISGEPGQPVRDVSREQAEVYCRSVGGRLPTPEEWLFAAAGPEARRYPWGPHGLVCRRSSFGLMHGPCAEGGRRPELSGARAGGNTPNGLADLSGNIAEWSQANGQRSRVHGGSFSSTAAAELKSWSTAPARQGPTVGFRCAYTATAH